MEQLKQYLENPDLLTPDAVPYLRKLSDRYPWFATPRILLAKATGTTPPELQLHLYGHPVPSVLLRKTEWITVSSHDKAINPELSVIDNPAETTAKSRTEEVIENFLAKGDVKIKPDEKLQTGEDLSVDSVHEDLEMVSEELAEIYLNQDLKSKAKAVYAKLSLLYPEKSVYFANVIASLDDAADS